MRPREEVVTESHYWVPAGCQALFMVGPLNSVSVLRQKFLPPLYTGGSEKGHVLSEAIQSVNVMQKGV